MTDVTGSTREPVNSPSTIHCSRAAAPLGLIAIANHLGRIDDESNRGWIEGNGHPTMGLEWGGDT